MHGASSPVATGEPTCTPYADIASVPGPMDWCQSPQRRGVSTGPSTQAESCGAAASERLLCLQAWVHEGLRVAPVDSGDADGDKSHACWRRECLWLRDRRPHMCSRSDASAVNSDNGTRDAAGACAVGAAARKYGSCPAVPLGCATYPLWYVLTLDIRVTRYSICDKCTFLR